METPDGKLRFVEDKDEIRHPKDRLIPILPILRQVLDAAPSDNLTYLVTSTGRPFTHGYFGNWFRSDINNADLALFESYEGGVCAFSDLFRLAGEDFIEFHRLAGIRAELQPGERGKWLSESCSTIASGGNL